MKYEIAKTGSVTLVWGRRLSRIFTISCYRYTTAKAVTTIVKGISVAHDIVEVDNSISAGISVGLDKP